MARIVNLVAFLMAAACIGAAFYLEIVVGILPCPLCIMQRGMMGALAIVFLIAVIHRPKKFGIRLYGLLTLLFSSTGIALAARQVWLQQQPADPNATCLPGITYLLQTMPLKDVVKIAVQGSAECAQVAWSLLGFSLAFWTLLAFVVFALISLYLLSKR